MPQSLFNSAHLKVERAQGHIRNLELAFREFVEANPATVSVRHNSESGHTLTSVTANQELPFLFALIIGDAVNNLRSALDHANWELRGICGAAQNRNTKLPIMDDRGDYEAKCRAIKDAPQNLIDFHIALEIFKGGRGDLIYSLHSLNGIDKHMILPTLAQSLSVSNMQIGGITFTNSTFNLGEGAEMFHISGGAEININTNAPLDIIFGDIEGFQFKPVIPTLVHLSDACEQMIGQFETFVREQIS